MKSKIQKSSLLILILVFAMFFVATSCKTQDQINQMGSDITAVNEKVSTVESSITTINGKLEKLAEKASLEQLTAALEAVKTTANAAATQDALTQAVEKLNNDVKAVQTTANAAATKAALDALNANLEALTAAAATQASVKEAVDALKADIELLKAADSTLATKAELESTKNAALAELAKVKAVADAAVTDAKLNAAITAVEGKITKLAEVYATKAELNAVKADVANLVTAVAGKASQADLTALQQKVAALEAANATLATKADLNAAKEDILGQLNTVKALAEAAVTDAKLNAAVAGLEEKITAVVENYATKAQVAADLAEVKAVADAAATKVELQEAADAVTAKINALSDVYAAKSELAAEVAKLNKAIADLADLTAEVALKASQEDLEALQGKVAEYKEALENADSTINGLIEAIDARVETLEGTVAGIVTDVEKLKADLADLKTTNITVTQFNALQEQVTALTATVNEKINKAEYEKASQLLIGDDEFVLSEEDTIVDWNELVADVVSILGHETEIKATKPFSLDAWKAIVNAVDSTNYGSGDYEKFDSYTEKNLFFLGRELSVQAIQTRFSNLKEAIHNLPTLDESFHNALSKVEYISLDTLVADSAAEKQWKEVVDLAAKAGAVLNHIDQEAYDTDLARFNKLSSAKDNLALAKTEADLVATAVEGLVLTTTNTVKYQEEVDNQSYSTLDTRVTNDEATYFPFANKAYYPEGYGMATLIPEAVETLAGYMARVKVLKEAMTKLTVTVLPTYSDTSKPIFYVGSYDKIATEFDAVTEWIATYELEDENRDYMYNQLTTTQTYAQAKAIDAFVSELETIYQEKVVDTDVAAKIAATLAVDYVVEYANKADLRNLEGKEGNLEGLLIALKEAVNANTNAYNDATLNYEAMKTKASIDEVTFKANVIDRLTTLDEAAAKLEVALAKTTAKWNATELKYNVTFSDYDTFFSTVLTTSLRQELDKIYSDYKINKTILVKTVKDENNNDVVVDLTEEEIVLTNNAAMNNAVEKAYKAISADYDSLTERLRNAAISTRNILEKVSKSCPLIYAAELERSRNEVGNIILEYGITDQNINLSSGASSASNMANFSELNIQLIDVLAIATNKAVEAQDAYVANRADIDTASSILTVKLGKKVAIETAYNELFTWAKATFGTDLIVGTETQSINEVILDYIAKVQESTVGTGKFVVNGVEYKFYTNAEAEKIIELQEDYEPLYDAAVEEWATLKVTLNTLSATATKTIHQKAAFDEANTALATFLAKYYEGTSTNLMADEATVTSDFNNMYSAYDSFYKAAEAEALRINNSIAALSSSNSSAIAMNYVAELPAAKDAADIVVSGYTTLYSDIDAFNTAYDPEDSCNAWFGSANEQGNMFLLARAKYMADAVIEAYNKAQLVSAEDQVKIVEAYKNSIAQEMYTKATNIDQLSFFYKTFVSYVNGRPEL